MNYSDNTYYNYIPMINGFVYKWAMPDDYLRTILQELYEDARSYAYMHWLQVKHKFPTDEKQATNYYYHTVKLKLDTYLNKFYKHQIANSKMVKGIVTYERQTLSMTYIDEEVTINSKEVSVMDNALLLGLEELVTHIPEDEEVSIYKQLLTLFIEESEGRDKTIITMAIQNAMSFIRANPDVTLSKKSNCFDFQAIADELNMRTGTVNRAWQVYKARFLLRHPEVIKQLKDGSTEYLF
jgi:hypothetical protein